MRVVENDNCVFFDVDDTLILWGHDNPNAFVMGIPIRIHEAHIDSIKRHHARGHYVVVWSAGGFDWARKAVDILEIRQYVDEVRCKPKWICDDKPAEDWTERYFYEGKE